MEVFDMPIGYILLIIVSLLIVFGVAHRVLDRMRLTDRQALLFVGLIFIGGIIPDIHIGRVFFNIGGALIPFALCVYLFVKAGTAKERWRAIAAAVFSGGAVFALGRFLPAEPGSLPYDNIIYGVSAGLIAYIFGRSRRSAFIGGVMGVLLADTTQGIVSYANGLSTPIMLGGAGMLDMVVISGLLAVLLAEVIGEIRERMQGGSAKRKAGLEFDDGEFVHAKEGPKDDDDD
jgi:uncharacterized membrane protein